MPRNKVQFQKGMSLSEFLEHYATEAQCEAALFAWRWPQGFVCPECGYEGHCVLGRGLYQCHRCHRQTSVTAGTLFAGTKLPLTKWQLGIYLLTQSKNGISALELSRQLGICYNSAWLMKHKLMQAMLEREQGRSLEGVIQMDDAYWGGRRRGYKTGRGTRGKTPFVAAVATDPAAGKPLTMRMDRVKGFRSREIGRWSRKHLAVDAHVRSDGLACFAVVRQAGCTHEALVTSGPKGRRRRKAFVGRHDAGQRQECPARHVSRGNSGQAPAALLGRIRLPLQPAIRPGRHDRSPGRRSGAHTADAIPARNVG